MSLPDTEEYIFDGPLRQSLQGPDSYSDVDSDGISDISYATDREEAAANFEKEGYSLLSYTYKGQEGRRIGISNPNWRSGDWRNFWDVRGHFWAKVGGELVFKGYIQDGFLQLETLRVVRVSMSDVLHTCRTVMPDDTPSSYSRNIYCAEN